MHEQLQSINDPNILKAMAYDAIAAKEEAERDLNMINNRLRQVMMLGGGQTPPAAPAPPTPAAPDPGTAANGGSVDESAGSDGTADDRTQTPPAGTDAAASSDSGTPPATEGQ